MEEIKFRAWIKEEKIIVFGYPNLANKHFYEFAPYEGRGTDFSACEVMQYTGLQDKNGTDIYFDDVVRFQFHDKRNPDANWFGTALITKKMGGGAGLLSDEDDRKHHESEVHAVDEGGTIQDLWEDEDLWTVEVIGNRHANPSLITHPYK